MYQYMGDAGSTFHSCTILGESDVLDHDIPGSHVGSRLKKWWWDLFLVSGSHEEARVMFTSSHALRKERFRQFRRHKGKIHPFSKFRSFWNAFMLHLFIFYAFLSFMAMSVLYGDIFYAPYILNAVIEILIIVDVVVNMLTGYVDMEHRRVKLDTTSVLLHYCSTKLFIHVFSAIPFQWIMFIRYGTDFFCSLCKCNRFIETMKFMNLSILYRVYEYSSYWLRRKESLKAMACFKLLRIAVIGLLTMVYFKELTDVIVIEFMIIDNNVVSSSRVGRLLKYRHVQNYFYDLMVLDLVRYLRIFFLFTFHPSVEHYWDRLFNLMSFIISKLINLWLIIEVYAYLSAKYYPNDNVILRETMTLNFIRSLQLSETVVNKSRQYFDFNIAKLKVIKHQSSLYNALPRTLKDEVSMSTYGRYVSRIPYFSNWPSDVVRDLVLMMREDIFLKNDFVFEPFLQSEGLYIVAYGELAVFIEQKEIGHLIDGDYFGEISLVTDKEISTSRVMAVSSTVVLVLRKTLFRMYMRQHPQLFRRLRRDLRKTFKDKSSDSTLN